VDGKVLKLADGDYVISYRKNDRTGRAGMTVTLTKKAARDYGLGGTRSYSFRIVR